jgi:iron complex outermembrane receptor protein
MRTTVRVAAVLFGLAIIWGCGGRGDLPNSEPASQEEVGRSFGELPDEQVGGAVATLGSEEESGGSFSTMVEMLRGRVPGLHIMEAASGEISVRIRGDQSVYFNQEPLLVVNGVSVPSYSFSNTLRTMNPADVESIQVLKDTGSTSSYGSRGAHGVIIIRLKRR